MEESFIRAVAGGLLAHGVIASVDEVTEQSLENQVIAFQGKLGLYVDGIIGPQTLWALQYQPALDGPKFQLVNVRADRPPGLGAQDCLPNFRMREDAASVLEDIAQKLRAVGGQLASSGGLRSLSEQSSQDRSATSFHYTGLALDLCINAATFNLDKAIYLCEYDPATARWQVWAKAEGGEEREIQAVTHAGGWNGTTTNITPIRAKVVDLTALFASHGFVGIRARPAYRNNQNGQRRYLSAEWWHFQHETPLTAGFSMFGIELLKIKGYDSVWRGVSRATQPNGVWRNRMAIFKKQWA